MTVRKTPRALIQVLDSEGKVTGFEIEFTKTYVGDDPDIIKSFQNGMVRDEVSAEEFAKYQSDSDGGLTREAHRLNARVSAMQEQVKAVEAESAALAEQFNKEAAEIKQLNAELLAKLETARRALA